MLWVLDVLRAFLWLPSPFLSESPHLALVSFSFQNQTKSKTFPAMSGPKQTKKRGKNLKRGYWQWKPSKKASKHPAAAASPAAIAGKAMQQKQRVPRLNLRVWDAEHPAHFPLPRSTGPYAVTRITTRMTVDRNVNIFGTFRRRTGQDAALGEWSNIFCASDVAASTAVNGANNATFNGHDMVGYAAETTVAPSAFSIQICNPEALQTTNGMTYVGVSSSQLGISNSPETWVTWANRFVSTMRPRAMSAASVGVHGKKVCSYPLNLESMCDFTELTSTTTPLVGTWGSNFIEASGFAPIVIYNPGGATLEVLVTTEWRTRFSLSHPASSTHKTWQPTLEKAWHSSVNAAVALGHGVVDVAQGFEAVAGAAARARQAGLARW